MKFKDYLKKYGAYVLALILFVGTACIYCYPSLNGKVLHAEDDLNWQGAAQEGLEYAWETGEGSWWSNSMFCGMPNYQIGAGASYRSDKLLEPFKRITSKAVVFPVWQLIFYFVCFYILLLAFGISPWLSIVGAFAIGMSTYFLTIIPAGHNTKVAAIALTAVTFAGFKFIFDKKYLLGACLTMVMVCCGYGYHPQMFYYYFLMIGLMWVAELFLHIKNKRYKDMAIATAVFAVSVVIGIGTSMGNFLANKEFVSQTTRAGSELASSESGDEEGMSSDGVGLEYATNWSYGIDETLTLLIPGFKGGANAVDLDTDSKLYKSMIKNGATAASAKSFCLDAPMYWGTQPSTAGNVYAGAIVCFLFLLGALIVRGPYKWALLASTLFSIMLAWGHNFMWLTKLVYNYFPLYSKFRAVSSILIVAEIAMPLLGFLGLKAIFEGKVDKKKILRSIYIAAGVTAAICLFFAIFGGMIYDFKFYRDSNWTRNFPEWLAGAVCEQRAALLRADCIRSLIFILISASVVWLYTKEKLKGALTLVILGVLVMADMWGINRRYFNERDYESPKSRQSAFDMQPYEELLAKDNDKDYRVWNLAGNTYNESRTSYRHNSLGGYFSAKLSRYQDLINEHLKKGHMPVANMLNAKYILIKDENDSTVLRSNPYANGSAWWVDNIHMVDGAREEIDALMDVNLYTTAVVDKSFEDYLATKNPGKAQGASVQVLSVSPKAMEYETNSSRDGVVVFSQIYYPFGWKATIDGKPAYHFRANYVLRAMTVPHGRHVIKFVFEPDSVRKGENIAIVFIVLMYLTLAGSIGYGCYGVYRRKKEQKAD